jgi:hypothetical protein
MSEPKLLRDLIQVSKEDVEHALAEQARDDPSVGGSKGHVAGFAASAIAAKVNEGLDTDLYEVLAGVWVKWEKLKTAAEESRTNPDKLVVQLLGEHDLKHVCYPTVKINVAELALPDVKFKLELIARFKSMRLSIRNAMLIAMSPGNASAITRLSYGNTRIREQPTPEWKVPAEIRLGEGYRIV